MKQQIETNAMVNPVVFKRDALNSRIQQCGKQLVYTLMELCKLFRPNGKKRSAASGKTRTAHFVSVLNDKTFIKSFKQSNWTTVVMDMASVKLYLG